MAQVEISEPDGAIKSAREDVRALLESLTGPSRGRIAWLSSDEMRISVDAGRTLRVTSINSVFPDAQARARLSWKGETYEIEAFPDTEIWVNGRKIGTAYLRHGDTIEFGDDGPLSRFRLCQHAYPTRWPVEEILSDAVAYARSSRHPLRKRMSNALLESARRLLVETSVLFRLAVIAVLVVLTILVAVQYRSDKLFERAMEAESLRMEALAVALAEIRQEALTAEELATLRDQLDLQLRTNAERLAVLESRMGASARVIRNATASVAFLQGAYGLRHLESGKLLRHVLDSQGVPLRTPMDKPVADVDGTGQPLEFQFTGTGFLLKNQGLLVTNRHVAKPWTAGDRMRAFEQAGYAPEMLKLIAFFPGIAEPLETTFIRASGTADVALLTVNGLDKESRGLELAQKPPKIGDEIIVMGFPTGLRALLAQAGREFHSMLEETGQTDFWTVATRLAEQDRIGPLASRGIVAQLTDKTVIYDAETTIGGSGGPVLDTKGQVIAVNTAILPEFGGANVGLTVSELRRLLAATTGD